MIQFNNSIVSSSWDHSNVSHSIGFSGTKDIKRLFPTYLKYKINKNLRIKGTDGKMVDMLLKNTTNVLDIEESNKKQWERFVSAALKEEVSCIIDAGALLAGNTLK